MLTKTQCYSLLSRLSTTGRIPAVLEKVKETFPALVPDAEKFLNLYDSYHDKKEFKHGNGYVDVAAWNKAFQKYSSQEVRS